MGTPNIASVSLQRILELRESSVLNLKSVYTKPPVWNNKKKELVMSSVNRLALKHGIDVRTPTTFKKGTEEIDFLKSSDIDLIIVVAFGHILPVDVLNIPRYGVLNLHPSLLPDLRGPSPIHHAILKGLRFSGVSVMAVDAGVDTGPIIAQQKVDIGKDEYCESLYERLSVTGSVLLSEVIKTIFKIKVNMSESGFVQSDADDNALTATGLIGLDERRVDFLKGEPLEIYAKIRAFAGIGGAYFIFRDKIVKLIEAKLFINGKEYERSVSGDGPLYDYNDYVDLLPSGRDDNDVVSRDVESPGTIIAANKSSLIVATTRKGVYIKLLRLKPEGKKDMSYIDFINGYRIKPGDICQ